MINFLFLLDKFKIDGYIIPKNDEYFNEYISPSEDRLKFLSNFHSPLKKPSLNILSARAGVAKDIIINSIKIFFIFYMFLQLVERQ